DYKGTLDLPHEKLELASSSNAPGLALDFEASDFLSQPHWVASAELNQVPLAEVVAAARQMGAALSQKVTAEGTVSGGVRYGDGGLSGRVEMQDAAVSVPGGEPLHTAEAAIAIQGNTLTLEKSTVQVGDDESADIEGSYEAGAGLDFRI